MKLTISKKLYGGFFSILLLLIVIASLNYVEIGSINSTYQKLLQERSHSVSLVKDLSLSIKNENLSITGFLLMNDEAEIDAYRDSVRRYNEVSQQLQGMTTDSNDWLLLQGLDLLQQSYTSNAEEMIEFKKQNKVEDYMRLADKNEPIISKFMETADRFVLEQEEVLRLSSEETSSKVASTKLMVLIISLLSIVVGLAIAYFISRMITVPIVRITAVAERIANGDLTSEAVKVKNRDELGVLAASFNSMSQNLRNLIEQVSQNALQVAASSEQLTAGAEQTTKATEQVVEIIEQVAGGSEEQIKVVQESVAFVNNMSVEASGIAASALQVSEKSRAAAQTAVDGTVAVQSAVEQMSHIQSTVQNIAEDVSILGSRSDEIGKIVEVIAGIAQQTNLLALNAAIEAARAGEAGRGFAVVSAEVRKLAEQSTESSQQIAVLVRSIQSDTERTVQSVHDGKEVVQAGIAAVSAAGESFNNIKQAVNSVTLQIHSVSEASQQMSEDTNKLAASLQGVAEVAEETSSGAISVSAATEQQLATMEEITSSSQALAKMSEELLQFVKDVKL
ncbi:methyl-accepting chemotaxis protein [Paenibacillus algorifonticola]|uniref:Methyl-accepting chemotaxis protein n=1 Tax=Paenibacillus algorifonticola TaxID=684063 RepID=A0A1I2F1F7_9BACL|nr:methyl-accepting chemotaxis protein [Paenibacillus algorifonticola]SFE98350.1 methyl-accepting chemotaxis protein [Paenibacillus algorifonticola]